MRLIAHHPTDADGLTQAVITHDDGQLYFYRFGVNLTDYHKIEDTDPVIVAPDNWTVDNLDFPTIDDVKAYLAGETAVVKAQPHSLDLS